MSNVNHPEWKKDNSLTAPHDRTQELELNTSAPPLTPEETTAALQSLNNTAFVQRFPTIERKFADPPVELQKIGLISFVPAKNAKPDEKGVYGFAKLRGNYATLEEATERAEFLIRNHDSYHQIYHAYVGRPFPITVSSDYSKEVTQIDLKDEMSRVISEDVKKKREKEQKEIEEIKKREEELLEDVKRNEEPTDDRYTTLRVKKAQLTWTYAEYTKKLKEMVTLIANSRKEIEDLDRKYPHLREAYLKKYMDARESVGLPTDGSTIETTFMKYLVEDLSLPEVDEEYRKLYGEMHEV